MVTNDGTLKCLIEPIGKFGEHWRGLSGCTWCHLQVKCMKESPFKKDSLIYKARIKRAKIPTKAKIKPTITRSRLRGFFTPT